METVVKNSQSTSLPRKRSAPLLAALLVPLAIGAFVSDGHFSGVAAADESEEDDTSSPCIKPENRSTDMTKDMWIEGSDEPATISAAAPAVCYRLDGKASDPSTKVAVYNSHNVEVQIVVEEAGVTLFSRHVPPGYDISKLIIPLSDRRFTATLSVDPMRMGEETGVVRGGVTRVKEGAAHAVEFGLDFAFGRESGAAYQPAHCREQGSPADRAGRTASHERGVRARRKSVSLPVSLIARPIPRVGSMVFRTCAKP